MFKKFPGEIHLFVLPTTCIRRSLEDLNTLDHPLQFVPNLEPVLTYVLSGVLSTGTTSGSWWLVAVLSASELGRSGCLLRISVKYLPLGVAWDSDLLPHNRKGDGLSRP